MSPLGIGIVSGLGALLFGISIGRFIELLGKTGLLATRKKLREAIYETTQLKKALAKANTELLVDGAGEGGHTSVEQSSAHLLSPADELREAVQLTRAEWGDDVSARVWSAPTKIHLALAGLLSQIADDMEFEGAFVLAISDRKEDYRAVRSQASGFRRDWTDALKVSRAIIEGNSKDAA